MLQLKCDSSISHGNDLYVNTMCCGTVCKSKILLCCCNFSNKQINKNSIAFSFRLWSIGRTQNISENICSFGSGAPNQWTPTKSIPVYYARLKTPFQNKIYCKVRNL